MRYIFDPCLAAVRRTARASPSARFCEPPLSICSTITSATGGGAMRPDRVVPFGEHPAGFEPYPSLVLRRHALPRRILLPVQIGPATKPGLRPRRADVLHDLLVAVQGLP